jgi:hypothetical protein
MHAIELVIKWLPSPLQAWLVFLLVRKGFHRRFPFFFVYAGYVTVVHLLREILAGKSTYFLTYWSTEALSFVLSLLAIYESFQAIFGIYRRFLWFRLLWPGTIAIIWTYSAWRAWVHPPTSVTRGGAILISVAILSAYTIVGLMILFFGLVRLVITRWYPYEFHIVAGLGLTSAGMVAAGIVRSQFGMRFPWFIAWAYPIASLIAVVLWVYGFLQKEPAIIIDRPPEVLLREMKEDLKIVGRIRNAVNHRRKKRRLKRD